MGTAALCEPTQTFFFLPPQKRSKTAHQGLFVKQNIVEEVIKKKNQ